MLPGSLALAVPQLQCVAEGEIANGSGSEQTSDSEDEQLAVAMRKMVKKKEFQVLMIHILPQVMRPFMEDMVRNIVKEEILSAMEIYFMDGLRANANAVAPSNERYLYLRFLNEVSEVVLTGKKIEGKGGTPIRVAIFDKSTEDVVDNGPESSAKVEILFLEYTGHDNKYNWSHEDFNRRIIKESDKTKPYFAPSYYVYLKKGIGVLDNAKLAHNSKHMKNCECMLGARIVENFSGIKVQEGLTGPFMVSDRRNKLYEKHYPPLLSDFVWRLVNIGRDGPPCKRLEENKVSTVRDFLFLHSVDPGRLQKIIGARTTDWKTITEHAKTCVIDDTKICTYNDLSRNITVVFDVIGTLKGVLRERQYIPLNRLSETEKNDSQEALRSAFEHQDDISEYQEGIINFHRSEEATYTSIRGSAPSHNLSIPDNSANHNDTTEPDNSFQLVPFTGPSGNANDVLMCQVPNQDSNGTIQENGNYCEPTNPGSKTRDPQEGSSWVLNVSEIKIFLVVRVAARLRYQAKKRKNALGLSEVDVLKRRMIEIEQFLMDD